MATPYRSDGLIAEARREVGHIKDMSKRERLIYRLADALEAAESRATEAEAALAQESRVKELYKGHARKVAAERDAALAVIEKARDVVRPGSSVPLGVSEARHWDRLLAESHRILSSVPADVLRERDRRVRAEAVKEFRVNDLRDRAERADERWKAWGDVNDAELRDRLFEQAAAIEQNPYRTEEEN